jgi:hypothetical protein
MKPDLAVVELYPEIKKWLEWYCYEHETSFSHALNHIIELGRQAIENESPIETLSKEQKILLQCTMESLLILKDNYAPDAEQRIAISERAKTAIRKTLGLSESTECLPS